MQISYTPDAFRWAKVGDIVSIDGRRHRLLKKTSTAVSVQRHYWFDDLLVKVFRKLGIAP